MDLKELLSNTKSKAIYIIDDKGQVANSYSENDDLKKETKDKIIVFSSTIFDMCNHFFTMFLKSDLANIGIKSNNENITLVKHHDYVICLLSDKKINIGVLKLSLKKIINK